ncbi:capsular polysaccharide synthesis protein [bacterium]|nr:capsular polysaccharide synthesis protein [bacterium]
MNRNIWVYWSQGFDNAPPLVKECLKSVKHYNPNWNIIELTDVNLKEYIDGIHHPGPLAAYSDIIRISLIKKYGGLWVDATVLFNKSLDEWLPEYITEGMFAFSEPTKRHNICSWFLYGEKDNFLVDKWKETVDNYWGGRKGFHDYLWFHFCFDSCYNQLSEFKDKWDKVKKYNATWNPASYNGNNPHVFAPYDPRHLSIVAKTVQNFTAPVYKLSHANKQLPLNPQINSLFIKDVI